MTCSCGCDTTICSPPPHGICECAIAMLEKSTGIKYCYVCGKTVEDCNKFWEGSEYGDECEWLSSK